MEETKTKQILKKNIGPVVWEMNFACTWSRLKCRSDQWLDLSLVVDLSSTLPHSIKLIVAWLPSSSCHFHIAKLFGLLLSYTAPYKQQSLNFYHG